MAEKRNLIPNEKFNEAGFAGYWKLNNNYDDKTSNGNDLTATNSPTFSTEVPYSP